MRNVIKGWYSYLLVFFYICNIQAQLDPIEHSLLTKYDQSIGLENTGLYKGILYVKEYTSQENNHQYFKSSNSLTGTITYEGQKYYEQELKYNLVEDQLIITLKNSLGHNNALIVNKNNVSSFIIDGHKFARTNNYLSTIDSSPINFFLEILLENDTFSFLKNTKKTVQKVINDGKVVYEFRNKTTYFLHYKNQLYKIKSKKDLLNIFKEYKNDLKPIKRNKTQLTTKQKLFLSMLKRVQLLQEQDAKTTT